MVDDVVVMSPRPGRVTCRVQIDLPRPRSLGMMRSPAFFEAVNAVREALFGDEADASVPAGAVEAW